MCCSQCHPHLSNTTVPVGLLHWWVTSDASTHQGGRLYLSAPSPTPHLTGNTGWIHALLCSLYHLFFNSVESALCVFYEHSYIGTHRLTPGPHISSEITLSFMDWADWICRDALSSFLLLWIGQIGNELKRHQPSHKRVTAHLEYSSYLI